MMKKLEIVFGKEYKTVNGRDVLIKHIGTKGEYLVYGLICNENGVWVYATWTKNGVNYIDVDPDSDLVEVKPGGPQEVEVPKKSKIVLGKEYRTRDGRKTKLMYFRDEEYYPVFGYIYEADGRIVSSAWTAVGMYRIWMEHNSDLVEVEQEVPQLPEVPKKVDMKISKHKSYVTANGLEVEITGIPVVSGYTVRGRYKSLETGLWVNTIWRPDGGYLIGYSASHPLDLVEVCNYKPAVETQVKKITTDKEYTSNGRRVTVLQVDDCSYCPVFGRYEDIDGTYIHDTWMLDGTYPHDKETNSKKNLVEVFKDDERMKISLDQQLDLVEVHKEELQEEEPNTGVTTLRSSWSTITFTDDIDVIVNLDLSDENIEVYTSVESVEEVTEIIGDKKYTYEKMVKKWVLTTHGSYYDMCLAKDTGYWFFYPRWRYVLEEKNK